jgi:hypothetical protein
MLKFIAAAAGAMALLAQPCLAQTAPADDKPAASAPTDPARLEAAHRLVTAAHLDTTVEAIFAAMLPQLVQEEDRAHRLTPEQLQLVITVLQEQVHADAPELTEMMAQVYAARLSEADLIATAEYYESEAGQHMVAAQAQLAQDGMAVGQAWAQRATPRVVARIQALMSGPNFEHP